MPPLIQLKSNIYNETVPSTMPQDPDFVPPANDGEIITGDSYPMIVPDETPYDDPNADTPDDLPEAKFNP